MQALASGPSLKISLRRGKTLQSHPPNLMGLTSCLHSHLWIHVLLVLTFCWPDKYSCISRLLVVLYFHPELSAGEDQYLILQKLFSMGQQIPHPHPVRSHSLQILTRVMRGEKGTHGFWWTVSTPVPVVGPSCQDYGSRRSKDRVAHIRRCWRFRSSLVSELQKVADAASDSAWNGESCRYWLSGGRV